jgi:tRNA threonylcarbamoyladenosine biosynthesis protein TsaE
VASPSFNIVNLYPTTPRVAHFDLYRISGAAPEEFLELADDPGYLVVAEWAENILRQELPPEALNLAWEPVPSGRALKISAWGKAAAALLAELAAACNQWKQGS